MGRRISKEFLHPSILEGVNNKIGNLDSLETDAKGNMVQAINELVEKLDNSAEIEAKEAEIAEGKELIANAVGEPLTAEESFDEMSKDINGLLSTFKTNMMNNGITVESNDRFKSLIDKIATMVEEGSNKGIQYTSGVSTVSVPGEATTVTIPFNETLNYIPNIVFVRVKYYQGSSVYFDGWLSNNQSLSLNVSGYGIAKLTVDNVTEEQLRVDVYTGNTNYLFLNTSSSSKNIDFSWYAIGVGEEDTTLRDSLADILENKGVDVSEEDDMASLITKVEGCFPKVVQGTDVTFAKSLTGNAPLPMTAEVWYSAFVWNPLLPGVYTISCTYGSSSTGTARRFNGRICIDRVNGEREIIITGDGYAQGYRTFSSCEVVLNIGDSVIFEMISANDVSLLTCGFREIVIEGNII